MCVQCAVKVELTYSNPNWTFKVPEKGFTSSTPCCDFTWPSRI